MSDDDVRNRLIRALRDAEAVYNGNSVEGFDASDDSEYGGDEAYLFLSRVVSRIVKDMKK